MKNQEFLTNHELKQQWGEDEQILKSSMHWFYAFWRGSSVSQKREEPHMRARRKQKQPKNFIQRFDDCHKTKATSIKSHTIE